MAMKPGMTIAALVVSIGGAIGGLPMRAAIAAPIHADWTGTVTSAFTGIAGGTLPLGVAPGSKVTGSFSYDPSLAGAPTFTFTSCSGCGSGVDGTFGFASGFKHTIQIGSHVWSADVGSVVLGWSNIFGLNSESFQIYTDTDEGHTFTAFPGSQSGRQIIGVAFFDQADPTEILDGKDVSSIPNHPINLAAATARSGSISNSYIVGGEPHGYSINFSIDPFTIPEPSSGVLLLVGLLGLVARHCAGISSRRS